MTGLKGTKGDPGPVGPQGLQGTPGSPGAYATVVAEVPPTFLGEHPGFSAVERPEGSPTGDGHLLPHARPRDQHGTPDHLHGLVGLLGEGFIIEPLAGGNASACEEGQLEIRTIELEEGESGSLVPVLTNSASFTVFVPGA